MNVRLLVAAAAIAAFGIAGAQAQPVGHGQAQQHDSVRGSAGTSGSAHTQKIRPKGSASGTVGAAPGRGGVNAGTSGSENTPPANVNGNARTGGSIR
ncbi:MAG: hypothetical protein NTAFB05_09060 [Nitrobacter sp.]|uniref:hypothetical protein n=1 Tax=Nitrobacter sp. TaxID=29420 RepID=UPI00387DD682